VCAGSLWPWACFACDCHLDWNKTPTPITFIGAVKHVPGYQPDKWSESLWWSCLNLSWILSSCILKKITKMSATIYFNAASHIWSCDEHDVLGKSFTSILFWDIAVTLYKWFYMVSCVWVHLCMVLSYFYWHPKVLFHVMLVWPVPLNQVLPHPQLNFPSKTWFFGIY